MLRSLFNRVFGNKNRSHRRTASGTYSRALRGEPLEDRRMLSAMSLTSYQEISANVEIEHIMNLNDSLSMSTFYELGTSTPDGVQFSFSAATGTPQAVQDGFAAAGDLWSALIYDDAIINIDIDFPALGSGILGSTSVEFYTAEYSDVYDTLYDDTTSVDDLEATGNLQAGTSVELLINRTANNPNGSGSATPYLDDDGDNNNTDLRIARANAKALGLIGGNDSSSDASISFSSNYTWDFDSSNGIAAGAFDFVGVAAHEIGHALGFLSGADILDNNSTYPNYFNDNLFTFVNTLDLFRFSDDSVAEGTGVIDWTADTRDKFFSIDGGSTEIADFSTGRVHGDGNQASHWKDGFGIGLLDPTFAPGETGSITDIDVLALDAIGWNVVDPEQEVTGSSTGNNFVIRISSGNNDLVEVLVDSVVTASWMYDAVDGVSFIGGGGDDTLTVDYTSGNPLPSSGVSFDGGAGTDTITVKGTTGNDTITTEQQNADVSVVVNVHPAALYGFTGVESLTVNGNGGTDAISSQYHVNSTDDVVELAGSASGNRLVRAGAEGTISLRAAIQTANRTAGESTIFLEEDTYQLDITGDGENAAATGDLDITGDVTLVGAGAGLSVIDAGGSGSPSLGDRVFDLLGSGLLNLSRVTVTGGYAAGSNDGGGILSAGDLIISDAEIVDNLAGDQGGGIYTSGGTLVLVRSLVWDNTAGEDGGGVYASGGTDVDVVNSTISSNTATNGDGGGVLATGSTTAIDIAHSTIAYNVAGQTGGGLRRESGTVNLAHTIGANNTAATSGPDLSGTFASQDYNLIENTSSATITGTTTHNITGEDPLLGALAANGGLVRSHALLPDSVAIDAGNVNISGAPSTDQRNAIVFEGDDIVFARIADSDGDGSAAIDIGAHERQRRTFTVETSEYAVDGSGERDVTIDDDDDVLTVTVNGNTAVRTPIFDDTILVVNGSSVTENVVVTGTGTDTTIKTLGGDDDIDVAAFSGTLSCDWGDGEEFGSTIRKSASYGGDTYVLRDDNILYLNGSPAWPNTRDFHIGSNGTIYWLGTSGGFQKKPIGSGWIDIAANIEKFYVADDGTTFSLQEDGDVLINAYTNWNQVQDIQFVNGYLYLLQTNGWYGKWHYATATWTYITSDVTKFGVSDDGIDYALKSNGDLWQNGAFAWNNVQDFDVIPSGTLFILHTNGWFGKRPYGGQWSYISGNIVKFAVTDTGTSFALRNDNYLLVGTSPVWENTQDFAITRTGKVYWHSTTGALQRQIETGWLTVALGVDEFALDLNEITQMEAIV